MIPEERKELEIARREEMVQGIQAEAEKNADRLQSREFPILQESLKTLAKILPNLSKAPLDVLRNLNRALYWGDYEARKLCDAIAEAEKHVPQEEEAKK